MTREARASPVSIRCEFLDLRLRRSCEEVFVRKVVAVELVSVDGVMESPERWAFTYSNDEMEETNAAGMAASDALLHRLFLDPAGLSIVDYYPDGGIAVRTVNDIAHLG